MPDLLRSFDLGQRCPIPRAARKRLFSLRIWSPRYKHQKVDLDRRDPPQSVTDQKDDDDGTKKSVSTVNLGVVNCQSICNKLDYILDHVKDNDVDIMAESDDESKNKSIIDQCVSNGFTLHYIPRNSVERAVELVFLEIIALS